MKQIRHFLAIATFAGCLLSCSVSQTTKDLRQRQQEINAPELFSILDSMLTDEERDALEFLYAYMPLPDMTDYSGDFYRDNVDCSLEARKSLPWGDSVPEREWRHFVLPLRVNNEHLDSSRLVSYRELRPRVEHLSMREAILEVNHWCHEYVSYQPSDARTSSPLQTMRSAIGRCGEESTFTVAALRSVGIPARQVYTPRWAHTDDNHAWVEAWADGRWHFLGACEPEPVLDLGWFNQPASRGLMMHTKVFGRYDGPEEQVQQNRCYTEINVTDNYAPVGLSAVQVVDSLGYPVEGAEVRFSIYNYAEFYPVATKRSNHKGVASLRTGKGDMVVWAKKGDAYGFCISNATTPDTTLLTLSHKSGERYGCNLRITPPHAHNNMPTVSPEAREKCNFRLAEEDSIRNAYIQTFDQSSELLIQSRGNHNVVGAFLTQAKDKVHAKTIVKHLAEKDKRDILAENLQDIYEHCAPYSTACGLSHDDYYNYLAQQRVTTEELTPYRGLFLREVPDSLQTLFRTDMESLIRWTAENIRIDTCWNPQGLRMAPLSVWHHRLADKNSRDIFFVALARTMGWPAEVNPVTGDVRYMKNGEWLAVSFQPETEAEQTTCPLTILYEPSASNGNPRYYSHFSICRLQDLAPRQLEYPEDATANSLQTDVPMLAKGDYALISGTRMADGSVLARVEVFPIDNNGAEVELVMRESEDEVMVIGSFDSEHQYTDLVQGKKSILSTTGRGYYIVGLLAPNDEPSTHILRDLAAAKEELDQWGGHIVLLACSEKGAKRLVENDCPALPKNTHIGIADAATIEDFGGEMPTMLIADTFNRVVFRRQGYTIGLGNELVNTLNRL